MRTLIFICLLLLARPSLAQIPNLPIETYQYDTNYIDNFGNLLAIRLVSPRRVYDFGLKSTLTKDALKYRPNLQSAFGIGLTYEWLAVDFVINPKWNFGKNEKLGETKEFNIKATLYLKKHMIDAMYRRYQGLHIANPADYLNPWDGNYPYRPDIKNSSLNLTYTIPFNYKKFSPKTSFQLDGRMKKSAGSVMYVSSFNLNTIHADSSIMPIEYADSFDPRANITDMNMAFLQQSIGYAYTFIHKKYYLTLSAMPGFSYAFGTVYSDAGKYNPSSLNFMIEAKGGLGYNSRRWYAGLYYIHKYQDTKLIEDLVFTNNLGELRFFVGYRIKAPYILHSVITN